MIVKNIEQHSYIGTYIYAPDSPYPSKEAGSLSLAPCRVLYSFLPLKYFHYTLIINPHYSREANCHVLKKASPLLLPVTT